MLKPIQKLLSKLKAAFERSKYVSSRVLEQRTGLVFVDITNLVENEINRSLAREEKGVAIQKSKFYLPGGSNNFGFFQHQLSGSSLQLLSKISTPVLLDQEKTFFKWHQDRFRKSEGSFAPKYLTNGCIGNPCELEFVTIEYLESVKKASLNQAWDLFDRAEKGRDFLEVSDQSHIELGGSRIKDVLSNFVANQDNESAARYISEFFQKRKLSLSGKAGVIDEIEKVLLAQISSEFPLQKDLYGFVHGDFKKANMLQNKQGKLLLIDFQYVCYGLRLWDLAFFLSKEKKRFEDCVLLILDKLESRQEKMVLVLCYVLAVMLHPNQKNFDKSYEAKIKPAIEFLT